MSDKYKEYLEQKRFLEEKRVAISKTLTDCERDLEELRLKYSSLCDHPTRFLRFPICSICYSVVSSK